MHLSEDHIYRRSTQYRYWSFTPTQLVNQRQTTNTKASQRVQNAVALARERALDHNNRLQHCTVAAGSSTNNDPSTQSPVPVPVGSADCLTAAEEQRLIDLFCQSALGLGHFLNFPIEVSATGVQYLRRFYLLNSPMTYDPQVISRSIMFIAAKSEEWWVSAEDYASKIPKGTTESVIAPEFLIMQGLRFQLDVKHPFRGLKGGALEMSEIARGNAVTISGITKILDELQKETLQKEMLALPITPNSKPSTMTLEELGKRLSSSYEFAAHVLRTTAVLTDAYFLYTPSQIWLSAHMLADEPITLFYLNTKIPISSPLHSKLLSTLRSCASILYWHPTYLHRHPDDKIDPEDAASRKIEIATLMRKLRKCTNPEKFNIDMMATTSADKRGIAEVEGEEKEKDPKRRRTEGKLILESEEEQIVGREVMTVKSRDDFDDSHRARFLSVPICPMPKA